MIKELGRIEGKSQMNEKIDLPTIDYIFRDNNIDKSFCCCEESTIACKSLHLHHLYSLF